MSVFPSIREIRLFIKTIKKQPPKSIFSLLFIFFLFLFFPGNSYYQTLTLKIQKPKVRAVNFEIPSPAKYPVKQLNSVSFPDLTAQSILVLDLSSFVPVFSKNPDQPLPPASLTKIMTALVVLDTCQLNKTAFIKHEGKNDTESLMGLVIDEQITIENLLYGLLVASGNDAAQALAENCAENTDQFIYSMNKKAQQLNLKNTHFSNESGLNKDNHYSSAWDLALLSAQALKNPVFKKIVGTKKITVSNIDRSRWHELKNKNLLLGKIPQVSGVKTGYTEEAGECLITLLEQEDKKILIVVLKSQDRFGETEKIINWVEKNLTWESVKITSLVQ